jgi:hypothetical protein
MGRPTPERHTRTVFYASIGDYALDKTTVHQLGDYALDKTTVHQLPYRTPVRTYLDFIREFEPIIFEVTS